MKATTLEKEMNMRRYWALAIAVAVTMLTVRALMGCATIKVEKDGTVDGKAFGQAKVTVSQGEEACPCPSTGGEEACPCPPKVSAEALGISEAFSFGIIGQTVTAARDAFLTFFGRDIPEDSE